MIQLTGVIVLNGVTYNYTLTPVAGGVQPGPSPVAVSFQRERGEQVHNVILLAHQVKNGIASKGVMKGKPYEMHEFQGSDNRKYVTFKPEIAAKLSPVVGRNEPVKIIGAVDDRGGVRILDVQP